MSQQNETTEGMSLAQFARSGRLLQVEAFGGERVYFAADKVAASRAPQGAVVYSPAELRVAQACSPELLAAAHHVKKVFQGTLLPLSVLDKKEQQAPQITPGARAAAARLRDAVTHL